MAREAAEMALLRSLGRALLARWRIWAGLGISLLFLLFVSRQVGSLAAVGATLGRANYLYVLPALVLYFAGVWFRAMRWHFLLRPIRTISSARLFPIVVIGYMANDILPARLGELVRAYVLGEREGVSKSAGVGTIAVERTFDGVAMLIFMGAVAAFVPLDQRLQSIFQFAAIIFAFAIVAFLALAIWRERSLALLRRALQPFPERLQVLVLSIIERFVEGLSAMQSWRLVGLTLSLSLAAWLAEALMYYVIALGFGFGLGLAPYVLTMAVANLGGMIPSSPGYVGTFEWFALASLGLFGMGADAALSYVLVVHLALLIPVSLLGFVYLWRLGFSLSTLRATELGGESRGG
jgi:glycosyltransferase 2 family protein